MVLRTANCTAFGEQTELWLDEWFNHAPVGWDATTFIFCVFRVSGSTYAANLSYAFIDSCIIGDLAVLGQKKRGKQAA
jgi:hypothetical protein